MSRLGLFARGGMSVDNDTGGVDLRICYERFDRRATLNVDEIYSWTDDEGKGKGETDKEREREKRGEAEKKIHEKR